MTEPTHSGSVRPKFWSTWTRLAPFVGFGMGYLLARFTFGMEGDAVWITAMLFSAVSTLEAQLATIRTTQLADDESGGFRGEDVPEHPRPVPPPLGVSREEWRRARPLPPRGGDRV